MEINSWRCNLIVLKSALLCPLPAPAELAGGRVPTKHKEHTLKHQGMISFHEPFSLTITLVSTDSFSNLIQPSEFFWSTDAFFS